MIYEVAVLTIAMEMKVGFLGREKLFSPHPITECVRHVRKQTNVIEEKVYVCNIEKLYARLTGIEFVTLRVSGSYET